MDFFICSVLLIMPSLNATTMQPTTTPPVTVVCPRASVITRTATVAPSSVDLAASDQHYVVLPPQLILRNTVRNSVGLTTLLQWEQPQSQMNSQAYAKYAMGPPQVNFLLQS